MDLASRSADYLPSSEGYLPLYILFVGVTAITNAISCYYTDHYVARLYPSPYTSSSTNLQKMNKTTEVAENSSTRTERQSSSAPHAIATPRNPLVTTLSMRTFASWNIAVGAARLYAAYHIHEASWYQMQMITCLIGMFHFGSEAFWYKTCRPTGPWFAPVLTAVICLGWSIAQYNFYVR